ncbi:hypothetical protein AJ80_02606 [Polytolypa hystricis UAMH7299]|uniref:Zn(2)-C6 fungal-type domain-containing protein n=1 Tax=Polytolypa hystricis (strain UAMH7299) TaxID=1447883 RepID=A0A2B7YQU1_POLH7|nr:hypothetical protein AJ80_02606 [Polytolypa hystricis UAMH7299]
MDSDTHNTPGPSGRAKRRWIDVDADGGQKTDEQGAAPKRHRISRACDTCRSRKDRCDGARPICSTCASVCRPCSYNSNPKKRGLPTGYLRALEVLWGVVFSKIRGSEQVVRGLLKVSNLPGHTEDNRKEGESSDVYLSAWKNSSVLREVERALSALDHQIEDGDRRSQGTAASNSPADAGALNTPTTDSLEWHLPERFRFDEGIDYGTPAPRGVNVARTSSLPKRQTRNCGTQTDRAQATPLYRPHDEPDTLDLRLPPNARQLFDIYFSYTHCWLPILEKHDILRTAFSYDQQGVHISANTPGSGDHALMWAVLALAAVQQSSRNLALRHIGARSDQSDIDALYTTARKLIPEEDGPYDIGHVQALLILAMVKMGQQMMSVAWILVGSAIRIASGLGLDESSFMNSSMSATGKRFHGRSKHVFLGCFILDTLVAAQIGSLPLLRKETASRAGRLDEDGLEEWHPWEDKVCFPGVSAPGDQFLRGPLHSMSTFNRLVSLVSILNDFSCCRHEKSLTLSKFDELERELRLWISTLPNHYVPWLQGNTSRPVAPHMLGLHIAYESIFSAILLHSQPSDSHGASRRDLKPYFTESPKKLAQLMQVYIDSYSIAATFPTFVSFFCLAGYEPGDERPASLSSAPDPELRLRLQRMSSQLSLVWEARGGSSAKNTTGSLIQSPSVPRHPEVVVSSFGHPAPQPSPSLGIHAPPTNTNPHYNPPTASVYDPMERGHRTDTMYDTVTGTATPSGGQASIPWIRPIPAVDTGAQRHPLQTPTQHLDISGHHQPPEIPGQLPSQVAPPKSSTNNIASSFASSNTQYPVAYSDPSMNGNTYVNIDGDGMSSWTRIPPDLDALFDELASLEGTDRTETQPVFMRNLGFAPNSGVSELYSYASHPDMYLMPQGQQMVDGSQHPTENLMDRIVPGS